MRCWGAGRRVIISRRALKNEFDMKSLICFRELTHTDGNLENKADRHLGSECREIWCKLLVSWANKLLMWGHNRWCSDHIYDWLAIKLVSEHTKQAGVYAPAVVLSTFSHLFLHFRRPFRPLCFQTDSSTAQFLYATAYVVVFFFYHWIGSSWSGQANMF